MKMRARTPMLGRNCEDLGLPSVRRFVGEKHHIFYMLDGKVLKVVRVIHGRRDVATEVRQ
jgi:plasmid stabilization system protein ParE